MRLIPTNRLTPGAWLVALSLPASATAIISVGTLAAAQELAADDPARADAELVGSRALAAAAVTPVCGCSLLTTPQLGSSPSVGWNASDARAKGSSWPLTVLAARSPRSITTNWPVRT
jgi:hypothetical protein